MKTIAQDPPVRRNATFAFEHLLGAALAELKPRLEDGGVSLRRRMAPSKTYVYGDRDQIGRTLRKLLVETVNLTEPGGELAVDIEREERSIRVVIASSTAPAAHRHLTVAQARDVIQWHGGELFEASTQAGPAVLCFTLPFIAWSLPASALAA